MVTVPLKYVNTFIDRHGRERSYFRYPKKKAVKLIGKPGSPEFMAQYNLALKHVPGLAPLAEVTTTGTGLRTWNSLMLDFMKVGTGKQSAQATRDKARRQLAIFCKEFGHRSISGTKVDKIEEWFANYHDRPGQHNNLLKAIRPMIKLALRREWLAKDPTLGIELLEIGSHHTWNETEIAQYEKRYKVGTRERTAFALFLFTGQRGIDIAAMRWPEYQEWTDKEGNRQASLTVQQEKGADAKHDRTLTIHCDQDLIAVLDAWKETCRREKLPIDIHQHILVNAYHQPFKAKTLQNWMARVFDGAKLPDRCVSHGLRKAAARRLAEAGCTPHEIMSVTGHKTLSEVQRYCDAAKQATLSEGAARKMRAHFRLVG